MNRYTDLLPPSVGARCQPSGRDERDIPDTHSPSFYGNLCRVAIQFYIANGHPGELLLVYWYARYAARSAAELRAMLSLGQS